MADVSDIKKEDGDLKPMTDKKYSVKFKRNRSSRACEVCHSRKVRCDATIHIPCTNCLTFGCECKFPEPKERKNAKKKKKHEASPDQNNPSTTVPATTIKRKYEPLAAISARSANIDTRKLFKRNSSTISFIGSASTAALLADHAQSARHFSLDDWIPPSLRDTISTTRTSLDTVQMEILRLRGAFHLPEKSLCDDLINTYFERIYPVEPIVDKKTFMEDYKNDTVSLLLLQSMLLAASRVSTNQQIFDSNDSNYLASCIFYQRAKALYDSNYESDPIAVVQSLLLFSRFWEGIDDILGNSFYWIRVATCVAQGYGFHRNRQDSVWPPLKARLSRILWWQLYIKDISASVGFGRPKMIQLDDCDVPMLTLDDLPPDLSRKDAEAFIQMIRLTEIMSIVLKEQYSVSAEKSRHKDYLAINHCDMIMSSWRNALPSSLQYSPHHHHPLSVNILNLYYYSVVCLVHRSNMVRAPMINGKQYPSEGIVFRASRIIADIGSKLLKSKEIRYVHALTIPIFFTASLNFICHMDSQNAAIAKSAKIGYNICLEALKEIGNNFLIATLIVHSMDQVARDDKARERFVSSLARKDQSLPQTRVQTPSVQTPAAGMSPIDQQKFPLQQQTHSHDRNAARPPMGPMSTSVASTPGFAQYTNQIPTPGTQMVQSFIMTPQGHPLMAPPMISTPHPEQPPLIPANPNTSAIQTPGLPDRHSQNPLETHALEFTPQAAPDQEQLEFPSLYLFTNTLPSSNGHNFDPQSLFPNSKDAKDSTNDSLSDSTTDNFNPNEFNLSLPEFDLQSFTNSISLQNLSSLNNYLDDTPISNINNSEIGGANSQDNDEQAEGMPSSTIYNFVN